MYLLSRLPDNALQATCEDDGGRMTRGFAVVAWPAQDGSSGVMSFIVCANGLVYEADLGEDTAELARQMAHYDPDERWRPCD